MCYRNNKLNQCTYSSRIDTNPNPQRCWPLELERDRDSMYVGHLSPSPAGLPLAYAEGTIESRVLKGRLYSCIEHARNMHESRYQRAEGSQVFSLPWHRILVTVQNHFDKRVLNKAPRILIPKQGPGFCGPGEGRLHCRTVRSECCCHFYPATLFLTM
jgi:hypothetical protein